MVTCGGTIERTAADQHLHAITAPIELLRDLHIVDTPGTNEIMREHERITAEFVPRSDLVLFVTSADRPYIVLAGLGVPFLASASARRQP